LYYQLLYEYPAPGHKEQIKGGTLFKRYEGFNGKTFGTGYRIFALFNIDPVFRTTKKITLHTYHISSSDKFQFFKIRKSKETEIHIMLPERVKKSAVALSGICVNWNDGFDYI